MVLMVAGLEMVTEVGAPLLVNEAVLSGTAGVELQLVSVVHSAPGPIQVPSTARAGLRTQCGERAEPHAAEQHRARQRRAYGRCRRLRYRETARRNLPTRPLRAIRRPRPQPSRTHSPGPHTHDTAGKPGRAQFLVAPAN